MELWQQSDVHGGSERLGALLPDKHKSGSRCLEDATCKESKNEHDVTEAEIISVRVMPYESAARFPAALWDRPL